MLKKLLKILIICAVAYAGLILVYLTGILSLPCSKPITYRIGNFDTDFGISKENFIADLSTASNVWSTVIGKELFRYDPEGKLTIDLIYDDRQKTTDMNHVLRTDINKTEALAGNVRTQYEKLKNDLAEKEIIYNPEVVEYNRRNAAYKIEVDYWNAKGGAPRQKYEELLVTHRELERLRNNLEPQAAEINTLIKEINTFADKFNLLVNDVSTKVETLNQTTGKEFQEGSYDPDSNTITIYEFETKAKLLRVLTHEFGHALSLDHNENPESIMYYLNKSSTLVPSKEDTKELLKICSNI